MVGAGDMDYHPLPHPPAEAPTPPRQVFDAPASSSGRHSPSLHPSFPIGADKLLFGNRDSRFFLPRRVDRPSGIFLDAVGAGRVQDDVSMQRWHVEGCNLTAPLDRASDHDEDADDGDGEIDGLGSNDNASPKYPRNSSGSAQSSSEKVCPGKEVSQEDQSSFASSREGMENGPSGNCEGERDVHHEQECRVVPYLNASAVAEPELQYTQTLQGGSVLPLADKLAGRESGQVGRKHIPLSVDFWESLRIHLSDPITGTLMDDAVILTCGHSFGSAGMVHVFKIKACYLCGQQVTENSYRPNLALRSAVQAFLREDQLRPARAPKRRRDRFELERCNFDDSFPVDASSSKGFQFPFHVYDRVIIKGNKRTPQRFVGRIAVVTTQCLNGWYVVKTLDNGESVKLQYRSLEKVSGDLPSAIVLNKDVHPNWL